MKTLPRRIGMASTSLHSTSTVTVSGSGMLNLVLTLWSGSRGAGPPSRPPWFRDCTREADPLRRTDVITPVPLRCATSVFQPPSWGRQCPFPFSPRSESLRPSYAVVSTEWGSAEVADDIDDDVERVGREDRDVPHLRPAHRHTREPKVEGDRGNGVDGRDVGTR